MPVIIISSSIKFYKIFSYNASTTKFYKVMGLLKINDNNTLSFIQLIDKL